LVVAPGQQVARWIPRDPGTHYVVAAGKFRKSLGRTWYAVYQLHPVPEGQCVEQPPVEQSKKPSSVDELLHFRLDEYHIRYSRPEVVETTSGPAWPWSGREG